MSANEHPPPTLNNGFMEELDDRFSEEAKMLARLAPKASMEAVRAAWARGLSVTVLEDGKIVSIAPDGTRTFVKELEPL